MRTSILIGTQGLFLKFNNLPIRHLFKQHYVFPTTYQRCQITDAYTMLLCGAAASTHSVARDNTLPDHRNLVTHLKYYACPKDMRNINGKLYIFEVTKNM